MNKERLNDYLKKENSELLGNFKWGMEGSNDFSCFMRLVRETIKQQQKEIEQLKHLYKTDVKHFMEVSKIKSIEVERLKEKLNQ